MNDKDVMKMISLIQEINIKKYDQEKYEEIVQEIYLDFQLRQIKNDINIRGGENK